VFKGFGRFCKKRLTAVFSGKSREALMSRWLINGALGGSFKLRLKEFLL
jgi:hypothetical protein